METEKEDALFSYKGYKAYQPMNTYWVKQEAVLPTEFRDGNVPEEVTKVVPIRQAISMILSIFLPWSWNGPGSSSSGLREDIPRSPSSLRHDRGL